LVLAPLVGVCSALPVVRCCVVALMLVLLMLGCCVLYGLLGGGACTPRILFPSNCR
jgi:hypothetical protein